MGYAISLTKNEQQIECYYEAIMKISFLYEPWYHLSDFQHPNLFCIPQEDPRQIYPMEWGLIAPWAETNIDRFRKTHNTLSAEAETVLTSTMYKEPVRQRRCLIIADGFFEPHYTEKGELVPKYCNLKGHRLFTFAGFYNTYGMEYWSVSLITRPDNLFFTEIHNRKDRMPLVLDPDFEEEWINPDLKEKDIEELLATSFMRESFQAHSVTKDLYKHDRETNIADILKKVE